MMNKVVEFACDNCGAGDYFHGSSFKDTLVYAANMGYTVIGSKIYCNDECAKEDGAIT